MRNKPIRTYHSYIKAAEQFWRLGLYIRAASMHPQTPMAENLKNARKQWTQLKESLLEYSKQKDKILYYLLSGQDPPIED